jgi:hypothetical protein
MQGTQIAIYALLAGCEKAKKDLRVSQSDIERALEDLPGQNSKFISKIRQTLMEKGMKDNTKNTAKTYNVPELLIIEMLRKYLNEEATQPGNTFYPFDTFDRFTQTFELPVKNWMHVSSQTDLPYKNPKKSYTTLEKIEEIRKSLKNEASAPGSLIEKWKEKINKKLFQETHALIYTEGKKDRFFNDIDSLVLEWCKTQNKIDQEELKKKCKEIVFFEDCNLEIQDNWLNAFKLFHSLG